MLLVDDMIAAAEALVTYTRGVDEKAFSANKMLCDAVLYEIAVLGEAANCVSRAMAARHPDIPWSFIAGMRHRVIHGYGSVDLDIVWDTATRHIPALLPQLKALRVNTEGT
jgi:uncharacterized protein with HEPN domain